MRKTGRASWAGAHLGLELIVVRRKAGDMLARWQKRWENNVARYRDLGGLAQAKFCPNLRTLTRIMEALDLPPEPPYTRMFFLSLWPSDLRQEHDRADRPEPRSEAAAKVVERYRDMRWPEIAAARFSE